MKAAVGVVAPDKRPPELVRDLEWLGLLDCTCSHAFKGLGILHGVSMGKGWVRMTTEPECPHHGTEAVRAWEIKNYGTSRIRPKA